MLFQIASKIVALIIAWVSVLLAPQPTPTKPAYIPPVTATAVVQQRYSRDQLDTWIPQSNWPEWTWPTVRRIVMCESSGIVGIDTNPPHVGLMQANVNLWGRVAYDPIAELNQGYYIYTLQGFGAWSCY